MRLLNDTLFYHTLRNFHEAGDVRAFHVVDIFAFGSVFNASVMDRRHDLFQFRIYLFRSPAVLHRVLAHLEARSCNTARVDRLTWAVEDLVVDESVDSFRGTAHV